MNFVFGMHKKCERGSSLGGFYRQEREFPVIDGTITTEQIDFRLIIATEQPHTGLERETEVLTRDAR